MTAHSIGVPKEIKQDELRVALTPEGVAELTARGGRVFVEHGAGIGASFPDNLYETAGATLCDARRAWECDVVVKVKEPQSNEFQYFRKDLILFTYLHLAAYPTVAKELCEKKVTAFAYETVSVNGTLPLLSPMSEIAGRLSIQEAARFLESPQGGRGVLLSGAPGVSQGRVSVLGAGHVGLNAAMVAHGIGAYVELFDINIERLREIDTNFHGQFTTRFSTRSAIAQSIKDSDAVIGAVLVPGGRAPVVVDEEMVKSMKPGSVIVDTAIDQGGCIETSHETTHHEPTFIKHDVIHYAVGNMPGAVSHTSTYALTNATLPYIVALATQELDDAIITKIGLRSGLNTRDGMIVNSVVKDAVNSI